MSLSLVSKDNTSYFLFLFLFFFLFFVGDVKLRVHIIILKWRHSTYLQNTIFIYKHRISKSIKQKMHHVCWNLGWNYQVT